MLLLADPIRLNVIYRRPKDNGLGGGVNITENNIFNNLRYYSGLMIALDLRGI